MGLKIEYLEEEREVYDITVEDNHNFYANNILVHNCQEIALPTKPLQKYDDENGRVATCILSAVNLGKINNLNELENLTDLAVRALDELIDHQLYPIKGAELYTKEYRTLGIGYIGLAHYLAKNKVKYDDPNAWKLVHDTTEAFQYYLLKASNGLSKEKGAAPAFNKSKWADGILPIDTYKKDVDGIVPNVLNCDWETLRADIKEHGLRNITLSTQFPAESSAVVSNATNGIEPPRDFLSIKTSKQGPLKMLVPSYNKLKNNYTLLWNMNSMEGYIKIVAVMQKFLDQSISANTSYDPSKFENNKIPMSVFIKDLLTCYKYGIKNLYYHNTNDGNADYEYKKEDVKLVEIEENSTQDDEYCEACAV